MDDEKKDNVNETVHGGDVYRNEVRLDFSVNLNPLEMPASVAEAMMSGIEEIHQYPDPQQQKLREGIASFEGIPVMYLSIFASLSSREPSIVVLKSFHSR